MTSFDDAADEELDLGHSGPPPSARVESQSDDSDTSENDEPPQAAERESEADSLSGQEADPLPMDGDAVRARRATRREPAEG